ncbi:MAG: nucleoside triphosphate pyrophosphohydrolase [candidate division Zixibacteria bacterium]|nr:nucleoside triphosphate pyrophosphohydrolase [candidate division Zixibacteria bacterium]
MRAKKSSEAQYTFADLVGIMRKLRGPGGCPWDRKQNHRSLLPYLLEESYEVIDSVDRRDMKALREELGDLLLQVIFHAQLAAERERFTIDDVIDRICRKLVARHPHVFSKKRRLSAGQVLGNWERIKLAEPNGKTKKRGVLDGVPRSLPALLRAYRVQEKTARFGFDWDDVRGVLDKIDEEVGELRRSMRRRRKDEIAHELGDVFFALVNLSRHLGIDPETALSRTNRRFIQRFQYIEEHLPKTGKRLGEASLAEMDVLWEKAKKVVG